MTDIAQSPLIVASPDAVKTNLLFIIDDSGSMNFDFLPDHINGDGSPDPALCRSTGATPVSSGNFGNPCCIGGNSSAACWTGAAPFGTMRGQPPFLAASFNGLAYDPNIRYLPPVKADGSSWASQTRAATTSWTLVKNDAYNIQNTNSIDLITQYPDTAWCVDATNTDCLRNDNYVLPGTVAGKAYTTYFATVASGTGSVATGAPDNATVTAGRAFGPHFYTIVAAEYCNNVNLRDCQASSSGAYTIPAPLRWCKTDADSRASSPAVAACQATRNGTFSFARFPTKFFSAGSAGAPSTRAKVTFTITGTPSCNIQVTAVTVGGLNLLNASTTSSNNRNTIGTNIKDQINAKTATGYTAVITNSGRTVTITAPADLNTTATISLTRTPGNCTFPLDNNTPAFSGYAPAVAAVPGSYTGRFQRIDIVSTAAPFSRPVARSDCADIYTRKTAGICTYDEEMTNFANWWTYYHSRMQSMKSSAALAFGGIGNNRRVGYLSINNSTSRDYLNLNTFEDVSATGYVQKTNWFSKLVAAKPNNSTPLRAALSTAGKLFAGKLNNTTLNGSTVKDPIQYSCQRNFTILSTDGFWNETTTPTNLDGTEIGDQDGTLDRPRLDGNATPNTLADVSAYYANTDLRTGTTGSAACLSGSGTGADVCGNSTNTAIKPHEVQNMKTFTLGLGASGYMQFSPNYLTDVSGDFYSVKAGVTPNTDAGICSWQTSGDCNWPTPASNTLTTIDDLWHAAVNGGGTYFSASNPTSLYTGLASAIKALDGQTGAAAAASVSNPNISTGDNKIFVSNFISSEWSGEVRSLEMSIETGSVNTDTPNWSARTLLDANTSRTVYMFAAAETSKLKPFAWASMSATEKANFGLANLTTSGRSLSQFCAFGPYCLSAIDQLAAAGEPLVNYLRGQRNNEGELGDPAKYFRQRAHVLGDIINSEAAYVSKSLVNYVEEGYNGYKATAAARTGMVYVAANDGMLHAFRADTGAEVWAYVPTAVLPNLYKLADKQYATQHQYFVDGSPIARDVRINGEWRTILIGGQGAGGRSYYALDVTNPAEPKALWEFTDNNLGLTAGKPEIGKLRDGTWVVMFGSGYNNVSPGDGVGRLYVLNAATGALIRSISTGAGDVTTPSGLAHITAWVDDGDADNTKQRVYAGDNLGNLWRFDVNNILGPAGYEAQRLATLRSKTGVPQPVTSRPELGLVGTYVMVFVGTGRYLGAADLNDTSSQSIYGIRDKLNTTDIGDPRNTGNKFVEQTLTAGICPAGTTTCKVGQVVRTNNAPRAVNLATDGGWFVDLPQSRERVNTDPQLILGTLIVTSNVVEAGNVCSADGSSWLNYFDYRTGAPVDAKNVSSVSQGNATSSRMTVTALPNGDYGGIVICSTGCIREEKPPVQTQSTGTRRISWRDLLQQ
ncbi:PilC/PilY family type IV pilus protein [Roseateles sp. P5_E7]